MPVSVVAERDFEREILRSELPVLVDFFADWCGPCKTMAPDVEALARELEGKAKVVKVDVDRSKNVARQLRIQSVPTTMVFHRGRVVAAEVGALRRAQLRQMVDPFLPRSERALRVAELAELLQARQAVAVDTRDAAAFARARLPGAVHMPLEQIESRVAELFMLPADPVLYCRSGDRTKELSDRLAEAGTPVGFLEGGLLAWEAEGLPIERPS